MCHLKGSGRAILSPPPRIGIGFREHLTAAQHHLVLSRAADDPAALMIGILRHHGTESRSDALILKLLPIAVFLIKLREHPSHRCVRILHELLHRDSGPFQGGIELEGAVDLGGGCVIIGESPRHRRVPPRIHIAGSGIRREVLFGVVHQLPHFVAPTYIGRHRLEDPLRITVLYRLLQLLIRLCQVSKGIVFLLLLRTCTGIDAHLLHARHETSQRPDILGSVLLLPVNDLTKSLLLRGENALLQKLGTVILKPCSQESEAVVLARDHPIGLLLTKHIDLPLSLNGGDGSIPALLLPRFLEDTVGIGKRFAVLPDPPRHERNTFTVRRDLLLPKLLDPLMQGLRHLLLIGHAQGRPRINEAVSELLPLRGRKTLRKPPQDLVSLLLRQGLKGLKSRRHRGRGGFICSRADPVGDLRPVGILIDLRPSALNLTIQRLGIIGVDHRLLHLIADISSLTGPIKGLHQTGIGGGRIPLDILQSLIRRLPLVVGIPQDMGKAPRVSLLAGLVRTLPSSLRVIRSGNPLADPLRLPVLSLIGRIARLKEIRRTLFIGHPLSSCRSLCAQGITLCFLGHSRLSLGLFSRLSLLSVCQDEDLRLKIALIVIIHADPLRQLPFPRGDHFAGLKIEPLGFRLRLGQKTDQSLLLLLGEVHQRVVEVHHVALNVLIRSGRSKRFQIRPALILVGHLCHISAAHPIHAASGKPDLLKHLLLGGSIGGLLSSVRELILRLREGIHHPRGIRQELFQALLPLLGMGRL